MPIQSTSFGKSKLPISMPTVAEGVTTARIGMCGTFSLRNLHIVP